VTNESAVQFATKTRIHMGFAVKDLDRSMAGNSPASTHDFEDCLSVVCNALQQCNLPAEQVTAWCSAMLDSDRVKFIAVEQLQSLRHRFQRTAAR
jgi:hypothetical protein